MPCHLGAEFSHAVFIRTDLIIEPSPFSVIKRIKILNIAYLCQNSDRLIIFVRSDHFGHIVNRLDFYQRLTSEKKLFYVLTSLAIDPPIIEYFSSINTEILYHHIPGDGIVKSKIRSLLYYFIRIIAIFSFGSRAILDTDHTNRITLGNNSRIKIYDIDSNRHMHAYYAPVHQMHTHRFLLNSDIGLKGQTVSFLDDWFKSEFGRGIRDIQLVAIKLRKVQYKTNRFHDNGRNSFPLNNYTSLINLLIHRGYFLLIDSEEMSIDFNKLPVLQLINIKDKKIIPILRTYYLTNAHFVLQQHSGPVHLCNISGVRNVVIDNFPLWQGTWSERDFIVPQEVIYLPESRRLSLSEIILKHPNLYLGKYDAKLYEFAPSRLDYIESCIDEIEGLYSEPVFQTELESARMRFRGIIPDEALNKISPSKFPRALVMESGLL